MHILPSILHYLHDNYHIQIYTRSLFLLRLECYALILYFRAGPDISLITTRYLRSRARYSDGRHNGFE